MDQLPAIELNESWKAEKVIICHCESLGVGLEGDMFRLLSARIFKSGTCYTVF